MNYLESDLEDWAEFNLGPLIHSHAVCIARQLVLPSGRRLDLLFGHQEQVDGRWRSNLTVVEMKKGRPSTSAVAQICDYMDEMDGSRNGVEIWGLIVANEYPDDDAQLILRKLPRIGVVVLEPRMECHAWHGLWNRDWHDKARGMADHCATGWATRGTEDAVSDVLAGPLDSLDGWRIAHALDDHEQAALGPGGD